LHASPVDVAEILREHVIKPVEAVVFTSATLSTLGDFEFTRQRFGLEDADEVSLASPFDFATQALLYLPEDLPDPADPRFLAHACERMLALLEVSGGRAFLLFTSHRQMRRAHELLRRRIKQPVLVQGERPKHLLIEAFKKSAPSVLFATASFWEGVDVVGDALSLVVMDKLPFAPPDDPLVAARAQLIGEKGRDPFVDYHVPRAALSLAQGFGRLIRHQSDRGVVALLDRRAAKRGYGKKVLGALPEKCPRSADLADVRRFFLPAVADG
jgi:ATP-dependent DNA helicase DinG